MSRIANRETPRFIRWRDPFETNNSTMFGVVRSGIYAVYSYGWHFPMAAYDPANDTWYTHEERYSNTTSRHQSLVRQALADHQPDRVVTLPSKQDLHDLIERGGMAHLVANRLHPTSCNT